MNKDDRSQLTAITRWNQFTSLRQSRPNTRAKISLSIANRSFSRESVSARTNLVIDEKARFYITS